MSKEKHGNVKTAREGALQSGKRQGNRVPLNNSSLGIRIEDVDGATKALTNVFYDGQTKELTFERAPVGSGGGSALYFGTVMGGNSTTTRTPTADFTGTSLLALPAPFYTDEGELAPYALPKVVDWDDYPDVMPGYAAYGGPLPVLPDGLCYVRLERPYNLLGKSWDAGYPPNIVNQITAPPSAITARVSSSPNKIVVHWDTELARAGSLGLFHLFDITDDNKVISLSSVTKDENTTTINLSKSLDVTHAYSIVMDARAVYATQTGTPEHRGRANSPQELSVVFELLSASMVICLNRVGAQSFYAGDLVSIQHTGIEIGDTKGVSRSVAEILSNATNARSPHTHILSEFGNDGGIGALP